VQRVGLVAHAHGVARVGSAVVAGHHIEAGGEQVHDLALALIAPLQADHGGVTGLEVQALEHRRGGVRIGSGCSCHGRSNGGSGQSELGPHRGPNPTG